MFRFLPVTVLLLVAHSVSSSQVAAPCLDRPPEDRPYSREHLLDVVKSQTPRRAEYLIRTCGVGAPFDSGLEKDLRDAGAEANLIAIVREVAPRPVVVAPKPGPVPERPAAPTSAPVAGPAPGDVRVNQKDGLRYVYIPPGTFRMGCSPGDDNCAPDEKPAHDVRISSAFWMGQTVVTVEAYRKYVNDSGNSMPVLPGKNLDWSGGSLPMTMVAWSDARDYCKWSGTRLPTEAEWEYAARAGTTGPRYGELNAIGWFDGNAGDHPHPVAQKRPNAFNLYDMLGSIWQWTADWYKDIYYSERAALDPQGPSGQANRNYRVLRGGSWRSYSMFVRASVRDGDPSPSSRENNIGFRCASDVRVR